MSETGPETGHETGPEAPSGRIGWRRTILLLLAGIGSVVAGAHGLGIPAGYVAAGTGAAGAAGYGAYRYPHVRNHFWGPWSKYRYQKQDKPGGKGLSRAWQANWRRTGLRTPGSPFRGGSRSRSPFRASGSPGRRGGSLFRTPGNSGRRSRSLLPSPGSSRRRSGSGGLLRPRRGSSGLGRGPGAGSRRGRGLSPGSRRGSGTFRRSRGTSGRPGGLARRRGRSSAGGPGAGILWGRRRHRPGTGTGGGPRARSGGRGAGRRPVSPGPAHRRLTRPGTWRRAGGGGTAAGKTSPGKRGKTRTRRARVRRWVRRTPPARAIRRTWRRAWRSRAGRAGRRTFRRAVLSRPGRAVILFGASPVRRYRRWRVQAPARQARRKAHQARMRAWKRKQARVNPKPRRWYAPWRTRFAPVWRVRGRRLGFRARIARRWRIWRGVHAGLGLVPRRSRVRLRAVRRALNPRRAWLRFRRWRNRGARPPAPWASRGQRYQRQVARFDQWRRDRFRRRRFRHRPPPAAAPAQAPARRRTPPAPAAAVPLPGRRTARPSSGRSIEGGHGMATSAQAAEGIRDLNVDWDDAEELHQILMHLNEIIEATQERLQRVADKLSETALKGQYEDAVAEAAGSLSGSAEQLKAVIGGGVLRG